MFFVFFFNDTATTEIYTLSLHDALPICVGTQRVTQALTTFTRRSLIFGGRTVAQADLLDALRQFKLVSRSGTGADRKSTRLNSSHANISYAVFCLKKKKITPT